MVCFFSTYDTTFFFYLCFPLFIELDLSFTFYPLLSSMFQIYFRSVFQSVWASLILCRLLQVQICCFTVILNVMLTQSVLWIAHCWVSFATLWFETSKVVISQSMLWITHGFSFATLCDSKVVISQSLLWIAHGFSFATLCDSKVVISQSLLWITHGFSFASQSVILKFQSHYFTVVALSVWIVHLWDSCCDSMTACIKPLYVCPTRVTWQVFQFAGFYWGYNKSGVCV